MKIDLDSEKQKQQQKNKHLHYLPQGLTSLLHSQLLKQHGVDGGVTVST